MTSAVSVRRASRPPAVQRLPAEPGAFAARNAELAATLTGAGPLAG